MNCVKAGLWLFFLTLLGCSSAPRQDSDTPAENTPAPAFNAALPAGPITTSPYLDSPSPSVSREQRALFAQALEQMQQKSWSQARQSLQTLVAEAPELSAPWLNLAIVWIALNEPGQARAALERSLAANPLNVDAYNRLGALERSEGHFQAAEKLYQQALAVWPHSVDSHKNLGMLYDLYLGQWPDALLHYQAAQYLIEQSTGAPDQQLAGWIVDLERRMQQGQ